MSFGAHGFKGQDFYRNRSWWHTLWNFIACHCKDILTEADVSSGHLNDHHEIDSDKAELIAERLQDLLRSGEAACERRSTGDAS